MSEARIEVSAVAVESRVQGERPTYSKNLHALVHPASLLKLLTLIVARRVVVDERLDELVTVLKSDDLSRTKEPELHPGDKVSYRDLFYLSTLPSHNPASRILARAVGQQLSPGSPAAGYEHFVNEMRRYASDHGWRGAVVACPSGLALESRLTAPWINDMMLHIAGNDRWLLNVLGTARKTVRITGQRQVAEEVEHTVHESGIGNLPSLVAAKTGTIMGTIGSLALLTRDEDGALRASCVLRSRPKLERDRDTLTALGLALNSAPEDVEVAVPSTGVLDITPSLQTEGVSRNEKAGVFITRTGSTVEMTFISATLQSDITEPGALVRGFRPRTHAYGTLTSSWNTERMATVHVSPSGRVEVRGIKPGEALRGTLSWQTVDAFPVLSLDCSLLPF